jgi:CheY-like chemotaxis protein
VQIIGEAADGRELLALTEELRPDVLIIDVELETPTGFSFQREVREGSPGTRVFVFTAHTDPALARWPNSRVPRARHALERSRLREPPMKPGLAPYCQVTLGVKRSGAPGGF